MLHRVGEPHKTGPVQFTRSLLPSRALPPGRPTNRPGGRSSTAVFFPVLSAVLALAACTTERGDKRRLLERVPPPQPLLTASAAYGNGAVKVQAWLGPSVRLRKADGQPESAAGRPHGGGYRERRVDTSSQPSDYFDRISDPFEAGASSYSSAEIDEMYGRVNYQYILPPRLALTLTIANTSAQAITLAIADVNSLLGNFAPRPEKLTLAPGQQGSIDPMLSTFENNFEQLDVTLTIKRGDQRETQVLKLRRAPPPAPASAEKTPQD
jgi:hypothetical protein